MSFNIKDEIEALTNLVSSKGASSDKMNAVIQFNRDFFKSEGYSYQISAFKEEAKGFHSILIGGLADDDVADEIKLTLAAPRIIVTALSGEDFDPMMAIKFISDCKELIDSELSNHKDKLLKDMPPKLRKLLEEFVSEDDDSDADRLMKDILGGNDDG